MLIEQRLEPFLQCDVIYGFLEPVLIEAIFLLLTIRADSNMPGIIKSGRNSSHQMKSS